MDNNSHHGIEFEKELKAHKTPIEGLVWYDLPVHGDSRGWFKENWQREKMLEIGLPDFGPVQNNISFNAERGVTRGLHAEPWDKYVSLGSGRILGAWRDLREGSETFGETFTLEMDPGRAIFVPRGVANGFQALEDNTVYIYLVNDHWSATPAENSYSFVNLADPTGNIDWPIPLSQAILSEKDKNHPNIEDAIKIAPKKILIAGSNGQLGKALRKIYPNADFTTHEDFDITDEESIKNARRWRDYSTIINAAAYTSTDTAETKDGKKSAWDTNAKAVANLAKIACEYNLTLVHISTDYVFDGDKETYDESDLFTPINAYGSSKAAGDLVASVVPKHYIVRVSWVIGDGNNFVRTMKSLADRDIKPNVVNDQVGRLSFTDTITNGIKHLLDTKSPYGIYNLTNDGDSVSWSDIAKITYELSGKSADYVTPVTTEEYYKGKDDIAPRPKNSVLNLDKIKSTGFYPEDWRDKLSEYLNS